MVESIFGGKASYPFGCYEGNTFHPRLAERRLSVQSSNLKTISEIVDDNAAFDGATSNKQEFENVASKGPTCYRRPRTMSLPAIYRDGSYLRIKQRATITPISCQNRRYSEPAALATEQIIHRLSQRSSSNGNSSVGVSDESENTSDLRSSVRSVESSYTTWRESSFQDLSTLRRHSDPMCYITEHAKKMGISMERRSKSSKKVVPGVTMLSACGEKPQPRAAKEHSPRMSRRRKSSLVPVPFSSPRQDTQKARNNQSFRRPLSFPPSKKESKRHCSLPALNLKPVAFLTGCCVLNETENITDDFDYNNNPEIQEQTLESEQPKDREDKYAANEDILLQWMKFFG